MVGGHMDAKALSGEQCKTSFIVRCATELTMEVCVKGLRPFTSPPWRPHCFRSSAALHSFERFGR